jgi:predicted RNA-binding Zn-ribbon protein involved in translation (DUF1610 family)
LTNFEKRDGILKFIEVKVDKFKKEFATKAGFENEVNKIDAKQTKVQVYYFNVDIKFILKARLYLLKQAFESNISKHTTAIGSTYQCDQCEYGRMKEKIYSEVDANGLKFKCPQCKSDLIECSKETQLTDAEQKICRQQIDLMWEELKVFDEYVVPVKFFGPGQHSAYVGHTQQY